MDRLSTLQAKISAQLNVQFDPLAHALWIRWKPSPCCNFNSALLSDLRRCHEFIEKNHGLISDDSSRIHRVDYVVFASDVPGIFQLGGDLSHFAYSIIQRNEQGIREYAKICIDLLYGVYRNYDLPLMTISLTQGICLGGGFELALATDWIIAEEQARFGFPEVRHGFLPGMGATSFLERCLSRSQVDKLLYGGKEFSAAEMEAIGLVSKTVSTGKGIETVNEFIKQHARLRIGTLAIAQARRRVQKLTYDELKDIVDIWVDFVMRLTPRDAQRLLNIANLQANKG